MIEFYPQIRLFHIFAVLLSGSIFALRGVAALAGARWPQARPLKWLTYAIDTSLLTAALLLVAILPWSVFANGWLLAKIGVLALRPQRPRRVRALYFAAALATFALMYGIARAHHPLAWLA